MTQQSVDSGRSSSKGDKGFHGRAGAADSQHFIEPFFTGLGIQNAGFLKKGESVTAENLGPRVALVARRVTTREHVAKRVGEAVVIGLVGTRHVCSDI